MDCNKAKRLNSEKAVDTETVDCTDQIIKATEETWRFFMAEKGKTYAPHYKSMISSWYEQAGFGVSIDPISKKYYFTAYYSVPTLESAAKVASTPRLIRRKLKS